MVLLPMNYNDGKLLNVCIIRVVKINIIKVLIALSMSPYLYRARLLSGSNNFNFCKTNYILLFLNRIRWLY